jgi:hypothetical protein
MGEENNNKFVVFIISGGHGKVILATAVAEAIKKHYPDRKIIVVSAYDAPWYFNPHIYRFYTFDQLSNYFYDDFIRDKDTLLFQHDPYHTSDYMRKDTHLIKTWCEMFNIPYNGEKPMLYINPREKEIARDKIKPDLGKPIMLLQTNGGLPSQQYSKKSWARDMPLKVAQNVVNFYSKQYRVIHIRLDEQPALENVEQLTLPHREIYAVFELSKKRIFIDSFAQHIAGALDLPSTVCWIVNKPEVFGYDIHNNVFPNQEMKNEMNKYSFIDQYNITGMIQEFPFENTVNIFDVQDIIKKTNTI